MGKIDQLGQTISITTDTTVNSNRLNLLSNMNRVETPFIKVVIGDYTFGVYNKSPEKNNGINSKLEANKIIYPNYMQSLQVKKINGQVNTYTLSFKYPITSEDDPNFFEKVFSSVSKSRKIIFSYGDLSLPDFIYKDEQALITDVRNNFDIQSSCITYTVSAVSSCAITNSGAFNFQRRFAKPSDIIKEIIYNQQYKLLDVFSGMRNKNQVENENLIISDDKAVTIEMKTNTTVLDYLSYLVSCMAPVSDTKVSPTKSAIYSLVIVDDNSGKFGGPYFKVIKTSSDSSSNDTVGTYEIDIGYPSQNIVLGFQVDNNESYTILYDYTEQLTQQYYKQYINDEGKTVQEYAPLISSSNPLFKTTEAERTWWTNVTQYPISATLELKGLLRPAILMTHVKLNVYFFGKKHISSGLYIITQQTDSVGMDGFRTSLKLTRIKGDKEVEKQVNPQTSTAASNSKSVQDKRRRAVLDRIANKGGFEW